MPIWTLPKTWAARGLQVGLPTTRYVEQIADDLNTYVRDNTNYLYGVTRYANTFPGVDRTGATDSTVGIQNALNMIAAAGGGTLYFPAGIYTISGQLVIPVSTTATSQTSNPARTGFSNVYLSAPIRITGDHGNQMPRGDIPATGAILNFTGSVQQQQPGFPYGLAQIVAFGQGVFEIDHVQLRDSSSAPNLFIYTTNSVLKCHDVLFVGNTAFTAQTDAVAFGSCYSGSGQNDPTGDATGCFQGYGSFIRDCGFIQMSLLAVLQNAGNGVEISGCNLYNTCGSNGDWAAPIYLWPQTEPVGGNVIRDNTLEIGGNSSGTGAYAYGIVCTGAGAVGNLISGNGFWDFTSSCVADVYFNASCAANTYVIGRQGALAAVSDLSTNANAIVGGLGAVATASGYSGSSTSATYASVSGCAVTTYTGTSALVTVTAAMSSNAALNVAVMSYGIDGTAPASDSWAVSYGQEVTQTPEPTSSMSVTSLQTDLTPGSHTFQVYIRSTRGTAFGTTATFSNMAIIVIPLP